jgi:hypothetical protein
VPKVRRQNLPPALFQHLLERIQSRKIPSTQLELLATWLDTELDVPEGEWYKRFSGMTVRVVEGARWESDQADDHRVTPKHLVAQSANDLTPQESRSM